jgi:hypothetical protein
VDIEQKCEIEENAFMKNPTLTVIESGATADRPRVTATSSRRKPRQSGGTKLRKEITEAYDLEPGGLALLAQTCEAVDRLALVVAQIARDGLMVRGRSGQRPHPLLKAELALRGMIGRNLQRLGVGLEPVQSVGRPGRGIGITFDDLDLDED